LPNAHLPFSQRWLPLLKVLLIPLSLHSCATGMRFTATLDALSRGAGPFETGAMLACISLFPAFFAVKVGRWLDSAGPRAPIHAALFAAAESGLAALFLPNALFGIFSLFIACLLTGLAFMLMNTVTQRLTGDVCRPGDRQTAFTALSRYRVEQSRNAGRRRVCD